MKKALALTAVFFSFILCASLVGSITAMFVQESFVHTSGASIRFFSFEHFRDGIFLCLPASSIYALVYMIVHRIRHRYTLAQFLVPYLVLAVLEWFLILPLTLILFQRVLPDFYLVSFKDPVIGKYIVMPGFLSWFLMRIGWLHELAVTCTFGFVPYIKVISLGLALTSIFGVIRLSTWRMINILNVLILFFGILIANSFLMDQAFLAGTGMPDFLVNWLCVIVNCVIAVLFVTLGIVFYRKGFDPNREEAEE